MDIVVANRQNLINEFFEVFSTCGGNNSIHLNQVAFLFGCSTKVVEKQLRKQKNSSTLKIEVHNKNIYLFGTFASGYKNCSETALLVTIRNFIETSISRLKNGSGEYLPSVISSIIPLIVKLEIDLSMTQNQIEALIRCAEWHAEHTFSLLLLNRNEVRFPLIRMPQLALLRIKAHSYQNRVLPHLRTFSEIELSNSTSIAEVLSRAKMKHVIRPTAASIHFAIFLHFFKILLFLVAKPWFPKRGDMLADLMEDIKHWHLSEEVLASYWTDPRISRNSGLEMVFASLKSRNILKSIRSLDWYLFCEAHCRWDLRIGLVYPALQMLAKKIAPIQNAEILLHRAILDFYRGALKSSFEKSSEVELLLHAGHDPFNRHTNLATSLRTAVILKTSILSAGLFHKARIIPEFNLGFLSKRIILCGIIQWLRDDSSDNYDSLIADLILESNRFPLLPRGTFELMICVALIEKKDFVQAKFHLESGVSDLKKGHMFYAYRKMIDALDRKIAIKKLTRTQNFIHKTCSIKYLESHRKYSLNTNKTLKLSETFLTKISLQFGEPGICPKVLYDNIDLSGQILSATNEKELTKITKRLIESWLPEFRFQGTCLNLEMTSFPPPPQFEWKGESQLIVGNIVLNANRFESTGGAAWTAVQALSLKPNLSFKFLISAPHSDDEQFLPRLELAKQISIWFCQVASSIEYQRTVSDWV